MPPLDPAMWESIRPRVTELYLGTDLTGIQAVHALELERGIRISIQQFKRKISEWDLKKNKSYTMAIDGNSVQFAAVETPQELLHISTPDFTHRTRLVKAPSTDEQLVQSVLHHISAKPVPRSLVGPVYRAQEALFHLITKYVNAIYDGQDNTYRQIININQHSGWQNVLSRCQVISVLHHNQKTWLDRPQQRRGSPTPPRRSVAYTDIKRVFDHDILGHLEEFAAISGPQILPEVLAGCITLVALAPQVGPIALSYLRHFTQKLHQQLYSSQDEHTIGLMNILVVLSNIPATFIVDMLRIACFCTYKSLRDTLDSDHPTVLHARTIFFRYFGANETEKEDLMSSYKGTLKKVQDLFDPYRTNSSDERILWVLFNYATTACYIKNDRAIALRLSNHLWTLTQPTETRWTSWTFASRSMVEAIRIMTLCGFLHNVRQAQPESRDKRRMLHRRARGKKSKKNKARIRRRLREQQSVQERPTQQQRDHMLSNIQRAIDQLPELSWDSKIAEASLRETLNRLSWYTQPREATQDHRSGSWESSYTKQGRAGRQFESATTIWREVVEYHKFIDSNLA